MKRDRLFPSEAAATRAFRSKASSMVTVTFFIVPSLREG
jgi:hypothetical protein